MALTSARPPGAAGLMHVALMCPDLAAALAFYRDGLGLVETYRWTEVTSAEGLTTYRGRALYLALGGHTYLELFAAHPADPAPGESGETPPRAAPGGPVHHIALVVPDVDEAYRKCLAAGGRAFPVDSWNAAPTTVRLNGEPQMTIRIAFVEGPSGEVIELYEQYSPVPVG
jgi:catechol 2,3-dioxygenase-like lactoylglutathione lyase family enzyme